MTIALPASVFNKAPAAHLSARYVHVDSEQIVDAMRAEGFQVASVQTAAKRNSVDLRFGRHMIDFRHPDMPSIGDAVPRIVFVNSHDGSTRASALAGVFRFVCSNGLIVGNTMYQEKLRHSGAAAATLVERMQTLAKNTAPLFQQIDRWSRKGMTTARSREFAKMAAQLRWGDADRFDVQDLLQVRRAEDDRGDLWTVFNRLQETTTQGHGLEGLTRTGRVTTARPLKEIQANLTYNSQLWELAEEFSNIT
jgi:hypothetical protein